MPFKRRAPPDMRLAFRHGDPRFPFFWVGRTQPAARWHGPGEGPVQYLADTPDGASAEFLRHEEISDPQDLAGVRRRLWAVELDIGAERLRQVALRPDVAMGDNSSYSACQAAARRLRAEGSTCVLAPSAALLSGGARGQMTDGGLREAAVRDGVVWAVTGVRPYARGWAAVDVGAPTERVLRLVRHFSATLVSAGTSPAELSPSGGRVRTVGRMTGGGWSTSSARSRERSSDEPCGRRVVVQFPTGAPDQDVTSARGQRSATARNPRSRRLFVTTKTELNAMAAPASIGLSSPAAASGIAATL